MTRLAFVGALASLLAAPPARAVGIVRVGGRPYATVGVEVLGFEPLASDAQLLVRGASSCFFAALADVEAPPVDKGPDLGGMPCEAAAADGDDQVVASAARELKALTFAAGENGLQRQTRARTLIGGGGGLASGPGQAPAPTFEASVMRFAPDGKALAFGDDSGRVTFAAYPDAASGARELDRLPAPIRDLRFAAGGELLVALDRSGRLGVWDWLTERPAQTPEALERGTRAIATAARAPVFARWAAGRGIEAYSTKDWKRTRALPRPDRDLSVFELDADGRRLAYSEGSALAVLDLATGRTEGYVAHGLGRITAARFLRGGRLVVGSSSGRLLSLRVPADLAKSVSREDVEAKQSESADAGPALAPLPRIPPPSEATRAPSRRNAAPPPPPASKIAPPPGVEPPSR